MEILGVPLSDILWGNLIVFIGSLTQMVTGIGLAMIVVAGLFFVNPSYVPASILLIAVFTSSLLSVRYFSFIDWKKLSFATIGRVPGVLVAIWFFANFNNFVINLMIGGLIILYSLATAFKWNIQPTWNNLILGSSFAGVSGTLSGIGGPPIAIAMQNIPKKSYLATISVYYILGNFISIPALFLVDKIASKHFWFTLFCLPSCLLAFWIAPYFYNRLNQKALKKIIQIFCTIFGILLILKTLFFNNF